MESVIASLNYTAPLELYNVEKPFFSNVPAPDRRQSNQEAHLYPGIKFCNIRNGLNNFNLDQHGFEIFTFGEGNRSDENFDSDEWIGREIYPVVESLLKARFGNVDILIFDHTVRKRKTVLQLQDSDPFVRATRQPSYSAHCDQTFLSGENRIRLHMGSEADERLNRRCQIINVWRPLFGPLEDSPLTYCDWNTVDVKRDYLPADLIFPHYIGEQYLVKHHPGHRWYFLGGQKTNEFTLLKCWDSAPDVARCVAHTSFVNPNTPKDARLRESIEFRCIVLHNE